MWSKKVMKGKIKTKQNPPEVTAQGLEIPRMEQNSDPLKKLSLSSMQGFL